MKRPPSPIPSGDGGQRPPQGGSLRETPERVQASRGLGGPKPYSECWRSAVTFGPQAPNIRLGKPVAKYGKED
jgi:hypothetical protein